MTREEYIVMKQAGQLTLPCFYQYYSDHIHEARNQVPLSFEDFGIAFPQFMDKKHPMGKESTVREVMEYFDIKFGLAVVDGPETMPNPFKLYQQNKGL